MYFRAVCVAVLAFSFVTELAIPRAHAQVTGDNPLHPSIVLKIGDDFLRHAVAQSAAYSPDGTLLATGGSDVRLWDVKARKLLKVMPLPNRQEDGDVLQMRFTPNGKTILVRGSGVGHVSGFDVESGKRLFRFQPDAEGVGAFDISPNEKILATAGGGSGTIILWNAETKQKLRTLVGHKQTTFFQPPLPPQAQPKGENVFVQSVAFSPDGKCLASRALYDDWVRVFDVESGKERHAFPCHSLYQAGIVFSPEGYLAAYRPTANPGAPQEVSLKPAIVLWDLKTGKVHQEIDWQPQWGPGYHGLAFSSDGKWMAGDKGKSRLCVWDRASGKVRFTDPRPISPVGSMMFSKDGDTLVTSDGTIDLWDLKTGKSVLADGGHTGMIRGLDVSSKGIIATGGIDATIRLWDAKTGKEKLRLEGVGGQVVFSPDGKTLVSAAGTYDGGMILWDAATGKEVRRFKLDKHANGVQPSGIHAAFSRDGKTLAVGTNIDITYHFFDVDTGKEKQKFSWHNGLGCSTSWAPCCFSPDGKHFAGMFNAQGNNFYLATLWDMTKQDPVILGEPGQHVFALAFSADGEYLAWWDTKEVHLWDVRAKKKLQSFKGGGLLAFSPDGRYLAAGKKLYPLNPKNPTLELPVHPDYQAFSADSKTLYIVPSSQSTVLILDVAKLDKSK